MVGRSVPLQVVFHSVTWLTESAVDVQPGDSSVVIRYQVDEFNHTWSEESYIYFGFTGNLSTLTHFPLEPKCEDYSFLDQAAEDFEHGLDSILTDSISKKSEVDGSFIEVDTMSSSVSTGFIFMFGTISEISEQQPAPNINFVNYDARLGHCFACN